MTCTLEPGVSRAHPSGVLAAVGRVVAERFVRGGIGEQLSNHTVGLEKARWNPGEHLWVVRLFKAALLRKGVHTLRRERGTCYVLGASLRL